MSCLYLHCRQRVKNTVLEGMLMFKELQLGRPLAELTQKLVSDQ